jgi:hypothetical protein
VSSGILLFKTWFWWFGDLAFIGVSHSAAYERDAHDHPTGVRSAFTSFCGLVFAHGHQSYLTRS